jgi:hypothetical protein
VAELLAPNGYGIGDVLSHENIPETMDNFRPHITLAYSNGVAPIECIGTAIKECSLPVADVLMVIVARGAFPGDSDHEWVLSMRL